MSLLQANVSVVPIFKDKKVIAKDNALAFNDISNNNIRHNALSPATGPLGITDGAIDMDASSDEAGVYVIRKGDSLTQIADMFGVSVNTILLANGMKKGQKLAPGDVLLILPISGIEYTVKNRDTLKSVAKAHKTDVSDIALYNGLSTNAKLAVGYKLMIPGADYMSDEGGDKPAPNLDSSIAKDKNYYATLSLQNLFRYFVNPVPVGRKTQGLHGPGRRGIDIGAPTGTEIYASADGRVLAVKTGCKVGQSRCGGGYGNMVLVEHPNGTKTLYAHMSKVGTTSSAQVAQGAVIGYVGNTGKSTGPHVHFEVFNAKNPGVDWSWANQSVAAANQ